MPLPQEAVMAVISACRSDDIYHQVILCLRDICGFQEHTCNLWHVLSCVVAEYSA